MSKTIGYKAFDKGFKCNNKQYEVGKTFVHKGKIKLCESGLHFTLNPLDVLGYYDLTDSRFAIVEAEDIDKEKQTDSKRVAKKLHIKTELDLSAFIKASVDFVWSNTSKTIKGRNGDSSQLASSGNSSKLASSGNSSQLVSSGNSSKLASSGDSSKLASSGDYSQLVSSGDSSQLASSGDYSKLASSGYYSQLASSGNSSKLVSSGNYSQLASSGYHSQLASSGDYSKLVSSGNYSQLASSGDFSVVAGIGYNNVAKATKGSWIVLAEWENNKPKYVKSVKVDGKKIKYDTWYKLVNGKFTEIK